MESIGIADGEPISLPDKDTYVGIITRVSGNRGVLNMVNQMS